MSAPFASRWILLVEDETAIRQCSTLALVRAGYHVDAVDGGQAGWEALQAHGYDLLITDNQMSGLSGADLIRKLRSEQMGLPVILASSHIVPELVAASSPLHSVSALPKPFTPDQLLALVAEVLRRARRFQNGESNLHWGINE
jgi:DNA-binding response OmpR family regulator